MTQGTYASLWAEFSSAHKLYKWAKTQGLNPKSHDDFHMTLAYSRKRIKELHKKPIQFVDIFALPYRWRKFGSYLVLECSCYFAVEKHQEYRDMGCTYDFPDYIPHVTVNENYMGQLPSVLPDFEIHFDRLIIEELDLTK